MFKRKGVEVTPDGMLILLLERSESPPTDALLAQVRKRVDAEATVEVDADDPASQSLICPSTPGFGVIRRMGAPHPKPEDLAGMGQRSPWWPEAAAACATHTDHLALVFNGAEDPADSVVAITQIAAACCKLAPVVAVAHGAGGVLYEPMAWRRAARRSWSTGELPLDLFTPLLPLNMEDGTLVTRSYAANTLGVREIEMRTTPDRLEEARSRIFSFIAYVAGGAVVRPGETIGFSAEDKVAVSVKKSFLDKGEHVVRLEG